MATRKLHIDIETFSSVDLRSSGVYKYTESPDFEILMIAYAFDNDDVQVIDLAQGEKMPDKFIKALTDPDTTQCSSECVLEQLALMYLFHSGNVQQ